MMKDYYLILEVNRNASEHAIKHNYRRLALKYHPDRNSSTKAHDMFLLINEAYQVLGNVEKRKQYNFFYDQLKTYRTQRHSEYHSRTTYNSQFNNNKSNWNRSHTRRKKTAYNNKYYYNGKTRNNGNSRNQDINFNHYAKYCRIISLAGFIFSLLLFVDYLLVNTYPYRIVEKKSEQQSANMYSSNELTAVSLKNFNPPVDRTNFYFFEGGDKMNVHRTPIFGITTAVERIRDERVSEITPNTNIYNAFSFLLVVLFVTSTFGVFIHKNPEYTFNAGVSSGILLPLVFYLVFFT